MMSALLEKLPDQRAECGRRELHSHIETAIMNPQGLLSMTLTRVGYCVRSSVMSVPISRSSCLARRELKDLSNR